MLENQVVGPPSNLKTEGAALSKERYAAPELRVIGAGEKLIQGCGGMSGSDRSAYRIFCQGE